MQCLKIGAEATIEVTPVLNVDGTADVTTVLTNADFLIGKNGVWSALNTTATSAPLVTDDLQGTRLVTLDAIDTGAVGRLSIVIKKTDLAAPPAKFMVIPASIYDAMVGSGTVATDLLNVSVTEWIDVATVISDALITYNVAKVGDAMTLTLAERNAISAALLALTNGVETGVTVKQAIQRMAAILAGKISGAGTGVEKFKGLDGLTDRVTLTIDAKGNRTGAIYE